MKVRLITDGIRIDGTKYHKDDVVDVDEWLADIYLERKLAIKYDEPAPEADEKNGKSEEESV